MEKMNLRYIIVQLLLIFFVAEGVPALLNFTDRVKQIVSPFLFYVISLLFIIKYLSKNNIKILELFGKKPSIRTLIEAFLYGLIMVVFLLGISGLLLLVTYKLLPGITTYTSDSINYEINSLFLIERIFITFIYPGIEELLFRGILFNILGLKYGIKKAILISSVVFALFHANFIWALVLSIFTIYMYLKKGSIFYPVVIHITNNLVASLVYIIEGIQLSSYPDTVNDHSLYLISSIIFLAIAAPGIACFYKNYILDNTLRDLPYQV